MRLRRCLVKPPYTCSLARRLCADIVNFSCKTDMPTGHTTHARMAWNIHASLPFLLNTFQMA
jgi:hypothetical protein